MSEELPIYVIHTPDEVERKRRTVPGVLIEYNEEIVTREFGVHREKVINAAREWFDWQDKAGHSHEEVDDALFAAVRALVEAEKSHE